MEKSIKLSIVIAYYNRKELFLRTLTSINSSKHVGSIEIVVVDDGSVEEERLEDIVGNYSFPINLIRVEPKDKWYTNPCIPFNKGFKAAKGDIVIIQNPECYHMGDVIDHALSNINDETYISYATYALSQKQTDSLGTEELKVTHQPSNGEGNEGWYNHASINPRPYHFTSCITKRNLDKMGGFDEEYALGDGFDDDAFLMRISKEMNLRVIIPETLGVLHQNHYNGGGYFDVKSSLDGFHKHPHRLWRNQNIFNRKLNVNNSHKPEKKYNSSFDNIPKIAHFYWEGYRFSYLHFLSIKSFIDKNPDWKCLVHTNKAKVEVNNDAWSTGEQKAEYTGKNYFSKLQELDLTINEIDFEDLGISPDLNPVYKSDLLRWYLLGTQGGAWIDVDILHLKPLSTLGYYMKDNSDGCFCYSPTPMPHFIIGFFLSKADNPFFMRLFEEGKKERQIDYQMYGNKLLDKVYRDRAQQIATQSHYPQIPESMNMENVYWESFYVHPWFEVNMLFNEKHDRYKDEHVIGVHWFNGNSIATEFCNKFDENYSVENPKTTIEEIINDSL